MSTPLTLFQGVLCYSLHEHQLGQVQAIELEVSENHFSIRDDGRGFNLRREVEDQPYLGRIVEQLSRPVGPFLLHGLGLAIIAHLCEQLEVTSHRDGQVRRQVIKGGVPGPVERLCESSRRGTELRLVWSLEVGPLPMGDVRRHLARVSAAWPELQLSLNGERVRPGAGSGPAEGSSGSTEG